MQGGAVSGSSGPPSALSYDVDLQHLDESFLSRMLDLSQEVQSVDGILDTDPVNRSRHRGRLIDDEREREDYFQPSKILDNVDLSVLSTTHADLSHKTSSDVLPSVLPVHHASISHISCSKASHSNQGESAVLPEYRIRGILRTSPHYTSCDSAYDKKLRFNRNTAYIPYRSGRIYPRVRERIVERERKRVRSPNCDYLQWLLSSKFLRIIQTKIPFGGR
jgi:hypothetical protein